MPENQLFTQDDMDVTYGIAETDFNQILDKVEDIYTPIFAGFGAKLVVERNWSDGTVNAYAKQNGSEWIISFFGGLARRKEITPDGFAMVVCHEIGHHLAGWPKYTGSSWAANEGNSDFYSAASCAKKLFSDNQPAPTPNPSTDPCDFLPTVSYEEEEALAACPATNDTEKTICKRIVNASMSLGKLLAALGNDKIPSIYTPDTRVVTTMQDSHPRAQCRLDTMVAGVKCKKVWDDSVMPKTKAEMSQVTCDSKPRCWYAP